MERELCLQGGSRRFEDEVIVVCWPPSTLALGVWIVSSRKRSWFGWRHSDAFTSQLRDKSLPACIWHWYSECFGIVKSGRRMVLFILRF